MTDGLCLCCCKHLAATSQHAVVLVKGSDQSSALDATLMHLLVTIIQGGPSDSHEVAREAWVDLRGDVQHALPLAQPKLLKGIQLYFAELDIQSKSSATPVIAESCQYFSGKLLRHTAYLAASDVNLVHAVLIPSCKQVLHRHAHHVVPVHCEEG